jgi:protein SCO1/2
VLDPEGKISRYLYGIQFLAKDLKLSLLEAGQGKIGSTLDKIILYCYHYDPYKNTYTLFATNVMRLGGILTIIFLGITIVGYWKNDHNLFRG